MIDPRVASGLRDLGPETAAPRERLLACFRAAFASFGYLPIETPHIERMEVLTGKGAGSEEVLRQIFEVVNKGGERGELALRFDLTVPLARFIAKHIDELGVPFKRYAIGSVFRGERPAKGRFREFTQCDFDTLGSEGVATDAETAQVIHASLSSAGIPDFTIAINNRKILNGMLSAIGAPGRSGAVLRSLDKLSKIGKEKVFTELTSARPSEAEAAQADPLLTQRQAERVLEFVEKGQGRSEALDFAEETVRESEEGKQGVANLRQILSVLDASGVPSKSVRVDLGLARGLDYYTGVIFETTVNGWERYGSISSGGRYDNLASLFTSRKIPGVGASIGLDRLLALLEEAGLMVGSSSATPVLVVQFPGVPLEPLAKLASELRAGGIGAELFPDAVQLGKQLGYGATRGRKLAVIVGPDELANSEFNLRDLTTREERKKLPQAQVVALIKESLASAHPGGGVMAAPDGKELGAERFEQPIDSVRGTRDWLPGDYAKLARLESTLLDCFAIAGYEQMKTPVLEYIELHERKSGAAIVGKLYELANDYQSRAGLCLRPELTASIVRAYAASEQDPELPWRVSMSGPVFRYEKPSPGRWREFHQVGVELLGAPGAWADAEVIWLAYSSLEAAGLENAVVKLGDVGLILEIFERSGVPGPLRSTLIELLSEAAGRGEGVDALGAGLDQIAGWLDRVEDAHGKVEPKLDDSSGRRLLKTLVPEVSGRRTWDDVLKRIQYKWELSKTLQLGVEKLRANLRLLSGLKGKAVEVLAKLKRDFLSEAPRSIDELEGLVKAIEAHGLDANRIEIDLGFGRGIGFYTNMVFEIFVDHKGGRLEVCGGGRYDGLATVLGSGRDPRGVGFAVGLERLAWVLEQTSDRDFVDSNDRRDSVFIAAASSNSIDQVVAYAKLEREKGVKTVASFEPEASLESAAAKAARLGFGRVAFIAGPISKPESVLVRDLDRSPWVA